MPINGFAPDLNTLQSDYQILTELRSSATTRTYLARHLKLNRDVTISVIRLADGEDPATLTLFAADARTLTVMRHRNVVPVIEGRWVTDGVFAIVRARVRGSTLDQLVGSAGPMPAPRVASTLQQVHSAIEWARDNGIVHRHVAADAIVFQQGSGRVLIELDPSSLAGGGVPDACTDVRTIGRLSYEMLSGQRAGDAAPGLSDVRPELSSEVVRETEALMRCNRDATSRDACALIALLGGKSESAAATPLEPRHSAPAVPVGPVAPVGHAVVVAEQRFGFNARLITAVAVAALIAVMGILLLHRRASEKRSASGSATGTSVAAGDVALPPLKLETTAVNPAPKTRPKSTPPSASAPLTMPMAPPVTRPRMVPPETRRHEPPRGMPPSTLPGPITPRAPRDSLASRDVCDSAEADDQRTCLTNAVERNDAWLTIVYQRLVAAIRRQADVQEGDPDPAAVTDLRAAQQRWTEARIAACRDVGEGAVYARARGQCFADQAAKRTRELEEMLAAIP